MSDIECDLNTLREWARSNPRIEKMWFFGSRLRGTEYANSDIDVAIQFDLLPGDETPRASASFDVPKWERELQPQLTLTLDLQAYVLGQTHTIEAALSESSRLIYSRE